MPGNLQQTNTPDSWLLEEYKRTKEWLESNGYCYLKADLQIPHAAVSEALEIYNDGRYFIPHRDSHGRGWESCTLHGKAANITTYDPDHKSDYRWTEIAELAPVMKSWLQDEFPNNGKYGRCRYMLLRPGGFIRSHTDTHQWQPGLPLKNDITSAINIAITQPENCYLRNSDTLEEVPFQSRDVFWFNNGPFHEAANFSREPRIHFIVHGGNCHDRLKLFVRSFWKEHPNANI